MGDSAITVRASICSVMRMIPISAVRAEPASPVTNTAQRTGPSSRMRASATAGPRKPSAPKRDSVRKICKPEHHAGERARQDHEGERPGPDEVDAVDQAAQLERRHEDEHQRLGEEAAEPAQGLCAVEGEASERLHTPQRQRKRRRAARPGHDRALR